MAQLPARDVLLTMDQASVLLGLLNLIQVEATLVPQVDALVSKAKSVLQTAMDPRPDDAST